MRELKFRAWDIKGERMYNLGHLADIAYTTEFSQDWGNNLLLYKVMQYTGLKDKNGVEIYEGDVVRMSKHMDYDNWHAPQAVTWDEKYLRWKGIYPCLEPWSRHEVIGNIYENKELLDAS